MRYSAYSYTLVLALSCLVLCNSECAHFNSGGIGIALNYCHLISKNGKITPVRWSCDTKNDLRIDVWYAKQTCTGRPIYSASYSDVESVDDYSCTGKCSGVVLKMYDDTLCKSNTWKQMKIITDECFKRSNKSSLFIECNKANAEVFVFNGLVCSNSSYMGHTSMIESRDNCNKIITCDNPHQSIGTTSASSMAASSVTTTKSSSVTTSTNHHKYDHTCSYVNMGGSGIPLDYCHKASVKAPFFGHTYSAFSFVCSGDKIRMKNYVGVESCAGTPSTSLDPSFMYNILDYECFGDPSYCQTVEIKAYTMNKHCSGNLWTIAKYVINQCFSAIDGGSHEYICDANTAHIRKYSDGYCKHLLNTTEVEKNCYEVLSCSNPVILNPSRITVEHHFLNKNLYVIIGIVVLFVCMVSVIVSIIVFCRQRQSRLEREIANMTANSSNPKYVLSSVNDAQLLEDDETYAQQIVSVDEGRDDIRSDIVITAYA